MHLSSVNRIPAEHKTVSEKVKGVVQSIDPMADVILFGSRARGDAADDSDWDFLILTSVEDVETLAGVLRREIRLNVEMVYDVAISLIVKNKTIWEDDYAVTNIYNSIQEEGIAL